MTTTTTTTRDDLTARLRRTLANMRTVVRRPASDLTGRNARGVSGHYSTAYGLLLRLEDVAGVEYAAPFGERLSALRIEAMRAGLLSPADVLDGETRAAAECPTPDAMRLLRDVRETLADESNMTASVPEPKRTRVRVRTSVRPGAVERIGAILTGAGFAVEHAPHSTLYVERGSVADAGAPVETFAVKMTDAAASELAMSVADTMAETGAEPARVEVAEAVRAVPRRGGVVRLTAPAYAWLLEWLQSETTDRASSRYTDGEMFGAWRALVALRARMEAEAPALVARACDISRETGAWIVEAFQRAEHEQRHNVLPKPRDDDATREPCVCAGTGDHDGQSVDSCDECGAAAEGR